MVKVYLLNRNELGKINYKEEELSVERRAGIERFKREEDKELSACAELLLVYALRKEGLSAPLPLDIKKAENGKPYIEGGLQFNLSHAGDYAACAVSEEPVGIDIEYIKVKDLVSPDRILHPEEAQVLGFVSNPNEKKKYFFECWTMKESYLKNLGVGLSVRPGEFLVKEDRLRIGDTEIQTPRDMKHIIFENWDKKFEPSKNLKLLEKRYVHCFEPGEIRGTDWKFDASYRASVATDVTERKIEARLVTAEDINNYR